MEGKPPKPVDVSSESWVSSEKDPAYWQALGELIEAFASAETLLFNYLAMCAGITHHIARTLLSGQHAEQIIGLIRRVWVVRPPDADVHEKMDDALCQFAKISNARNSIVHHVSFVTSEKGRVSSNITRAFTANRAHEFRGSPNNMTDMIADLEKISTHILYAQNIISDPQLSCDDLKRDLPALAASWRYIPPEDPGPSKPNRRRRNRH